MLDLKAKLLEAGLVTEKQVEEAKKTEEEEKERKKKARAARDAKRASGGKNKGRGKGPRRGPRDGGNKNAPRGQPKGNRNQNRPKRNADGPDTRTLWKKRIEKLTVAGRSEQYDVIRKWVDKTRLDRAEGLPSEQAVRFFFDKGDQSIGWLTVEPTLSKRLTEGTAGVVAYMGFNGLNHCAVPRDVAVDVHKVRPEFLRALAEYDFELQPIVSGRDRRKGKRQEAADEAAGANLTAGMIGSTFDATAEATKGETTSSPQETVSNEVAKQPIAAEDAPPTKTILFRSGVRKTIVSDAPPAEAGSSSGASPAPTSSDDVSAQGAQKTDGS